MSAQSNILSQDEVNTSIWRKIERHLTERLNAARLRNDGPLDPAETAQTRGEIKALKGLLSLGRPLPPVESSADGL